METLIIFYFALLILMITSQWKINLKAEKVGWACIVPIYNLLILFEIIGKPWWWLILVLIPGINIIFTVWMTNLLAKSFGKNVGFTIGLLLLPFIFYPILGFGDAQYIRPAGK